MGAKRNFLLGLVTIAAFIAAGAAANAETAGPEPVAAPVPVATGAAGASIDYDGFSDLVEDLAPIRAQRLVPLATFTAMANEAGTLILDTRSAEAFAAGHVEGAVNLPFSDFTEASLAEVIGDPETRILIYCNNNFTDDVAPVMVKRAPLALNIPTFVTLHGYGYESVYELADLVSIADPAVNWVSPTAS